MKQFSVRKETVQSAAVLWEWLPEMLNDMVSFSPRHSAYAWNEMLAIAIERIVSLSCPFSGTDVIDWIEYSRIYDDIRFIRFMLQFN